jgi:hypothetical protein
LLNESRAGQQRNARANDFLPAFDELIDVPDVDLHLSSPLETDKEDITAPDPFSHCPHGKPQDLGRPLEGQKTGTHLIDPRMYCLFLDCSASFHCLAPPRNQTAFIVFRLASCFADQSPHSTLCSEPPFLSGLEGDKESRPLYQRSIQGCTMTRGAKRRS